MGPSSSDSRAAKDPSNMSASKLLSDRLFMYTSPVTTYPSGEEGVSVLACTPLSANTSGVSAREGSSGIGTLGASGPPVSSSPSAGFPAPGGTLSSSSSVRRSSSTASRPERSTGLCPMASAAPAGRVPPLHMPSSCPLRMLRANCPCFPNISHAEEKSVLAAVAATT